MGTTATTTTPNRQPSEADLAAECRRFVPTPAALSAVGNVLCVLIELLITFHFNTKKNVFFFFLNDY